MQIKRGKCYSLMLLCLKINCINITKKSPYHPQAGRHRALFQIYLHVILLMSAICFHVTIMVGFWFADTRGLCWGIIPGIMFRNNDKLFWEFFINLLAIIRAMFLLLAQLKENFYSSNFKKNKYEMGAFWYCYFGV